MITRRDLDLITSGALGLPAAGAGGTPQPTTSPAATEYVLVREDPPSAEGWSLQCRRGGRVVRSIPLAPRGAAPRVRPAVAQAVAVRVLAERGVFVSGWNQTSDGAGDVVRFVARRPHGADALPV
ncbi:MAG TPA: hypothetical protein VK935_13805 [Actinomycetospora sp.]|nr:hypothetical protein [Actinomycetospora sp.]